MKKLFKVLKYLCLQSISKRQNVIIFLIWFLPSVPTIIHFFFLYIIFHSIVFSFSGRCHLNRKISFIWLSPVKKGFQYRSVNILLGLVFCFFCCFVSALVDWFGFYLSTLQIIQNLLEICFKSGAMLFLK